MMRTTIALDDELAAALQRYREQLEVEVSVNAVVQAALRDFLSSRTLLPKRRPFRITPAPHGSGHTDTSINHDRVGLD